MDMSKAQYADYLQKRVNPSPMWKNCLMAFWTGGLICTVGEFFRQLYTSRGWSVDEVSAATSITMVLLGALFTGLGVYDKAARYAGAGTIVPITGFANSVVSPALEFKSEGLVMGTGAKMFIVAGPVLVFGITASVLYGLVLYLLGGG
ncbi:MAG: stage V sporulation protein AC [Eubacteriales bacterium]|jgi:stage V sporulation protein AC